MTAFVIVAVFFTLLGFLLGFFLTSRVANKNQGQMKHCKDCEFYKSWNPYKGSSDASSYSDDPDFISASMSEEG